MMIPILFLLIGVADSFQLSSRSIHISRHIHNGRFMKMEMSSNSDDSKTDSSFLTTPRETRVLSPIRNAALLSACGCCSSSVLFTPESASAAPPTTIPEAAIGPLEKYFPTSIPSRSILPILQRTLTTFNNENTLLATSMCSDEVNSPLVKYLCKYYSPPFYLGGLGGVPFSGVSGLKACISHIPTYGKLLIVLGSHIGYDKNGAIGLVDRIGQGKSSTACGAVIGALKLIEKGTLELGDTEEDEQEEYIIEELGDRLPAKVLYSTDATGKTVFATYQAFCIARDYLISILDKQPNKPEEVAILAGVMINGGESGEDLFQPLLFETGLRGQKRRSLYEEAFGPKPTLQAVLGSKKASAEVLRSSS